MTIIHLNDENFEKEISKTNKPILVDFWADWCAPCKQISPILEEISQEKIKKIQIAKVNIDENPNTPTKYNVRGIPTLMIFNNGKLVDTKVGSIPKSLIVEWIDSVIN